MPTHWSQDKYIQAYVFAAEAHKTDSVPGRPDLPYIIHPSIVSMEIIAALQAEDGLDGDLATQCALLHDVIEDTSVGYDQIKKAFGENVALGVSALSKNKQLEKSLQMKECLARIRQQPREIWMVKLADRITNLQPPPKDWTVDKISEYRQEAIEILDALGSASEFLAQRLKNKLDEYK